MSRGKVPKCLLHLCCSLWNGSFAWRKRHSCVFSSEGKIHLCRWTVLSEGPVFPSLQRKDTWRCSFQTNALQVLNFIRRGVFPFLPFLFTAFQYKRSCTTLEGLRMLTEFNIPHIFLARTCLEFKRESSQMFASAVLFSFEMVALREERSVTVCFFMKVNPPVQVNCAFRMTCHCQSSKEGEVKMHFPSTCNACVGFRSKRVFSFPFDSQLF